MDERTLHAAIAGLLHDIGKFALRAGEGASRTWDSEAQRDYGYKHALLSEDFIARYVPESLRSAVKGAAGSHHRPSRRLDYAVALGDRLSAGERADDTGDAREQQPRQLLSIFCDLTAGEQTTPRDLYLPLTELRIAEEALFPGEPVSAGQVWKDYEALWGKFTRRMADLQNATNRPGLEETYLEALQPMLQRYTWSIPSAYYHARPDISLYDHARITAALAAVLVSSPFSDDDLKAFSRDPKAVDRPLAALVCGDFTGVQDFIYTISARGATSALRGRSFYLQLLAMAVVRTILRRLDLPTTNLVYNGGANFYLLVRPEDITKLEEIRSDLGRFLHSQHQGDLYLAMAALPLKGSDFYGAEISRRWSELSERVNQAKLRKFSELGAGIAAVFEPAGDGGNEERQCQVCGMEHSQTRPYEAGPRREPVRKCPACLSYETLGDQLRRAEYLAISEVPAAAPGGEPGGWEEALECLGLRVALKDSLQGGETGVVYALNDEAYDALKPTPAMAPARHYLVNVTPIITQDEIDELRSRGVDELPAAGSIKPFHAMEAESKGIKRLGVLRMDVDNLGRLFGEGLKEKATLSRVAALSQAVSLYFEGWVGVLAQNVDRVPKRGGKEHGDRVYSIYSGGDDLFFVGSWDATVELARQVRADLTRYAAGHPGIHASGGLVLIGGKQPLALAAQEAKKAEEDAKRVRWVKDGKEYRKDGFCFLGQALPWRQFGLDDCGVHGLDSAHALMHLLEDLLERQKDNASLLRRLIRLHERYQEAQIKRRLSGEDRNRSGEEQALWGPWNWLSEYTLERMSDKGKNADIQNLRERLKQDQFRSIEWIGLAARWTELLKRKS